MALAVVPMEEFSGKVGVLGGTRECQAVQEEMRVDVQRLRERAQASLAEKIKRVLQEPLNDICKEIIVAKCDKFQALSEFQRETIKECTKWIRKHEIGVKLSKEMTNRVGRRVEGTGGRGQLSGFVTARKGTLDRA